MHGACTEHARSVHWACTERARSVHCACRDRVGSVHGAWMRRAQGVHGACTVRARSVHGVCTERAQSVRGVCTGCARGVHKYKNIKSWDEVKTWHRSRSCRSRSSSTLNILDAFFYASQMNLIKKTRLIKKVLWNNFPNLHYKFSNLEMQYSRCTVFYLN